MVAAVITAPLRAFERDMSVIQNRAAAALANPVANGMPLIAHHRRKLHRESLLTRTQNVDGKSLRGVEGGKTTEPPIEVEQVSAESRATELNEFAVAPIKCPSGSSDVTTVTPVAKQLKASRIAAAVVSDAALVGVISVSRRDVEARHRSLA
jgi:hypothetical protein